MDRLSTWIEPEFLISKGFWLQLLSLGLTTPLMPQSWTLVEFFIFLVCLVWFVFCFFFFLGGETFNMLKSIDLMDLVKLLSSSRRSDRVYYQGKWVHDLAEKLLQKQGSRISRLTTNSVLSVFSMGSRSTFQDAGFSYVSPGCTIKLIF